MKRFAAATLAALALTASPALAADGPLPGAALATLNDSELDQVTAGTELEIENVTVIFVRTGGHSVVQIVDDSKNVIQLANAGNIWFNGNGKGKGHAHGRFK